MAAGRDKEGAGRVNVGNLYPPWEGGLPTTSLEFDYLHRKSRCEMLIWGDDICNEALHLARVFRCLFPLLAEWPKSDSSVDGELGSHRGIEKRSRYVTLPW